MGQGDGKDLSGFLAGMVKKLGERPKFLPDLPGIKTAPATQHAGEAGARIPMRAGTFDIVFLSS